MTAIEVYEIAIPANESPRLVEFVKGIAGGEIEWIDAVEVEDESA